MAFKMVYGFNGCREEFCSTLITLYRFNYYCFMILFQQKTSFSIIFINFAEYMRI